MRSIKDALDIGSSDPSISSQRRQKKIVQHQQDLINLHTKIKQRSVADDFDGNNVADGDSEEETLPVNIAVPLKEEEEAVGIGLISAVEDQKPKCGKCHKVFAVERT